MVNREHAHIYSYYELARRIRSKIIVAGVSGALTMTLAACSSGAGGAASSLDELKESGTVRIGVADTPPLTVADTTPTGIVPELTEMVFHKLGVKNVEAVPMDWNALIPSLQSGRIDVAAAGFFVTPVRCRAIILADPSVYTLDGMAVAKGNPLNIKTYADIAKAGVDMGAISGTATIEQAEAAGVDPSRIQDYADLPTMLDALKAGRIAAGAYDNVTIAYALSKSTYSDLSATEPTAPIVDGAPQPYSVSVGFAKDADELAEAFNRTQAEMFESDAFDELIEEEWGLPKEDVRPSGVANIDDVCASV